ncbi:hypothetical protein TSUD_222310 [Trifolium subterraneum]|uniref:R13L1/DRL21-like LRR repeat region domain-containing protein n=1 Tax=Trifolium subterraneum TaxID=3900 RepID=A0A2Z6M014_TRISU|nr:hypothetical protein TSUD_222310 [Trifolium subterraneum]
MGERVKEGTLHASFDFGLDLSCGIPDSMFDKAKKLRTILLPYKNINNPRLPHEVKMTTSTCDKIFTTFKSLRVLDLHDLGIKIVPNSIEEMKYLSKKHVVTGGLRELTVLNNLKGNLEILHLEQVKFSPSIEMDKDEFLKNKERLQQLTLRWDRDDDDDEERTVSSSVDVENEEKLLECLQPHQNLKVLFVVGYNGITLSNWLHSLHCLVKFTFSDSPKCEFLPPMEHLANLKVLHLRRLNSLEFIAENSATPDSATPEFFKS